MATHISSQQIALEHRTSDEESTSESLHTSAPVNSTTRTHSSSACARTSYPSPQVQRTATLSKKVTGRTELRRAKLSGRGKFGTCFVLPEVWKRLWDPSVFYRKEHTVCQSVRSKKALAVNKWLGHALKGGAGPAHRWCAREDALPDVPLVIRDSQGAFKAYPQCVAEHHAQEWRREWNCEDTSHV